MSFQIKCAHKNLNYTHTKNNTLEKMRLIYLWISMSIFTRLYYFFYWNTGILLPWLILSAISCFACIISLVSAAHLLLGLCSLAQVMYTVTKYCYYACVHHIHHSWICILCRSQHRHIRLTFNTHVHVVMDLCLLTMPVLFAMASYTRKQTV